jgi:hypothetical protein
MRLFGPEMQLSGYRATEPLAIRIFILLETSIHGRVNNLLKLEIGS